MSMDAETLGNYEAIESGMLHYTFSSDYCSVNSLYQSSKTEILRCMCPGRNPKDNTCTPKLASWECFDTIQFLYS